MSEIVSTEHAKAVTITTAANVAAASQAARRAVVFAEPGASKFLEQMLAHDGYAVEPTESLERALQLSEELAPDVLLIEVRHETSAGFTLVRRVRAQAATYALPVVLIFRDDSAALRKAALRAGVDDYFAVTTPPNELRARLNALFWRVEAGRRQALAPGDQHGEIDNFMSLLDRMRADVHERLHGVLALLEATARTNAEAKDAPDKRGAEKFDRATRDRTLRDAHGFLKLNLRRRDSVAFYGPTMLLIYLPQRTEADARRVLAGLRDEFLSYTSDGDIAVGLSSFAFSDAEADTSTTSIENLIERAELAVAHARARDHVSRILDGDMNRRAAPMRADNAPTAQTIVSPAPPAVAKMNEPRQPTASGSSVTDSLPARAVATTSPPPANAPLHSATSRNMAHSGASSAPPSPQLSQPQARHPSVATSPLSSTPSLHTPRARQTVVRETRRADSTTGDLSLPTMVAHSRATGGEASSQATRHAIEGELERRARGEVMPRRLLLTVSDAARMAQLNLLVRSAGYEARAAFDGQQALDLLRIERPDLLLLDYALQGIDGVETIKRLRKQLGGTLTLPVVLLLREEETQARQEAIALGVRGVVLTPYDPAALLDSVRTVGKRE